MTYILNILLSMPGGYWLYTNNDKALAVYYMALIMFAVFISALNPEKAFQAIISGATDIAGYIFSIFGLIFGAFFGWLKENLR